jgi:hypothetical protein
VLRAILTGVSLITAAESARDDDFACPIAAPAKVKVNFARSAEHVETDVSLYLSRGGAENHERWKAGSNENLRVRARRTYDRRACSSQTG